MIAMQTGWLFLMRQLLQYGLDLQEFGAEMCGADVREAKHENDIAIQSTVGSLLKNDELGEQMDRMERGGEPNKRGKRARVMDRRASSSRQEDYNYRGAQGQDFVELGESDSDSEDGDFQFLDDDDLYDHDGVSHSSDEESPSRNSSQANIQPQVNMGQVLEMMTALTNTMSSLNHKIENIESRVGDGSALLVMPPGENQWDAKKG